MPAFGIFYVDAEDRKWKRRRVAEARDVEERVDVASTAGTKTASRRLAMVATLLVASTFPLLGCSRTSAIPGEVPVFPLKGQITLDGQPTPGAFVTFHPATGEKANAVQPTAWVDKDGSFALTTYRAGDGAPAGEYVVTVHWQQLVGVGDNARLGPNLIPPRYDNPQASDLRFRVAQGANELAAIRLRR
jgi:hypothetical protein